MITNMEKRVLLFGVGTAILFMTFAYIITSVAWLIADGLPIMLPGAIEIPGQSTLIWDIDEFLSIIIIISAVGGFFGSIMLFLANNMWQSKDESMEPS